MKTILTLILIILASISTFADQWDPEDDHFPSATDLGEPDTSFSTHGPHFIGGSDLVDWFKFAFFEDRFYELVITDSEVIVELYKSDFASVQLIDKNEYSNINNRIWFKPNSDGIYYVKLSQVGTYFLNYLQRPEPTPTPTATFTPTLSPTPTFTFTPTLSPTQIPTMAPTPTFTPINSLAPSYHFKFNSDESYTRLSGGFTDPPFPGGSVNLTVIPNSSNANITDGFGAEITLNPGELELIMMPEIQTYQKVVFIRVQAMATNPDMTIGLAALEGNLDGSIGSTIPANSEKFVDEYNSLYLLYKSNTESIIPIIQVLNNGSSKNAHVYIDNIEIYVLDEGVGLPYVLMRKQFSQHFEGICSDPNRILAPDNLILNANFENDTVGNSPRNWSSITLNTGLVREYNFNGEYLNKYVELIPDSSISTLPEQNKTNNNLSLEFCARIIDGGIIHVYIGNKIHKTFPATGINNQPEVEDEFIARDIFITDNPIDSRVTIVFNSNNPVSRAYIDNVQFYPE